jgi:hypothetical protein
MDIHDQKWMKRESRKMKTAESSFENSACFKKYSPLVVAVRSRNTQRNPGLRWNLVLNPTEDSVEYNRPTADCLRTKRETLLLVSTVLMKTSRLLLIKAQG